MSFTPDKVRQELGNPSVEDLSDATINDAALEEGSFWSTCIRCADILSRRYAHRADYALMEYKEAFSQRAKAWKEIADNLRTTAVMYSTSHPYAGGISLGDKQRRESDTDRTPPSFRRNMMEVDVDGS